MNAKCLPFGLFMNCLGTYAFQNVSKKDGVSSERFVFELRKYHILTSGDHCVIIPIFLRIHSNYKLCFFHDESNRSMGFPYL